MFTLLCRLFLKLTGWKAEMAVPVPDRCVLIAAPHTSNWDFPYAVAIARVLGVRTSWVGKHTLFRFPFGGLMRTLGGIPVRRDRRSHMVDQLAQLLRDSPRLALMIPTEGTRSRTEFWKSGFLHVARNAGVPIVCGYLDFPNRRGGFGPVVDASRDAKSVMDDLRAFYRAEWAKDPSKFGPMQLRDEASDTGVTERATDDRGGH